MTPEEAIEIIWERHMDCEDYRFQFDDYPDGYDFEFDQAILMAAQALEEIQKYREIGTIEECRELKERNTPKKTKLISGLSSICPECGAPAFRNYDYCKRCGQAIDWSKE